jgi:hypothetical protein
MCKCSDIYHFHRFVETIISARATYLKTKLRKMNKALSTLYHSKWSGLTSALKPIIADNTLDIKPANPLLLYVDDEEDYRSADIRLMIFGQETNGWYEKADGTIDDIQNLYDGFFNKEECWNYGGQFWNGLSRFLSSLQAKFPDKKTRMIWNNVVKIGKHGDKGFPPDYVYEIERESFHVIPNEIEILQQMLFCF